MGIMRIEIKLNHITNWPPNNLNSLNFLFCVVGVVIVQTIIRLHSLAIHRIQSGIPRTSHCVAFRSLLSAFVDRFVRFSISIYWHALNTSKGIHCFQWVWDVYCWTIHILELISLFSLWLKLYFNETDFGVSFNHAPAMKCPYFIICSTKRL